MFTITSLRYIAFFFLHQRGILFSHQLLQRQQHKACQLQHVFIFLPSSAVRAFINFPFSSTHWMGTLFIFTCCQCKTLKMHTCRGNSFTLLLWICGLHILGLFKVISAAELFLSKLPLSCILFWLHSQTAWLTAVCTWAWVGSSSPPRLHSISPSDFTYPCASQETRYTMVCEIKGAGCDLHLNHRPVDI